MSMSAQLGVVLDGILVSYFIGADAMTGVSSCMPITQAAASLAILISVGAVSQISMASGEGNREAANRLFSMAIFLAVVTGCLLTIGLLIFSERVGNLIAPTTELATFCKSYLVVLLWCFPASITLTLMCDLVRADGFAKLSSKAIILQQCVNVSMDVILMGVFKLGLDGAALATILGDITGAVFVFGIYFSAKERTFKLVSILESGLTSFFNRVVSLCRAGFPAALGMGLLAIQFWCMYQIVGQTGGTDGAKIYAACMLYLTFLSMFADGINQSMLPILSVLYGEKDYKSIRMLMRYVCVFLMKIVGASVIVAIIFPQELLSICRIPAELTEQGANDVRLFSLSFFGVAWSFMMIYYYSAVGQNTAGNLLSMASGLFVVVPSSWIFANFFGRMGVWLGLIFAGLVGISVLMIYVRQVCAKSNGQLSDFYLIEKNGSELLYDVSLKTTIEDATKLSKAAVATLENQKLTKKISMKTGLALEEITAKLAQLNEKEVDFDVRILNNDEEIILALRDNGKAFSPMDYQPPENDPYRQADGIIVLKAVAKEIRYDRVLGLNQTVITIAREKL
ncbi:MAG: hypothetical protein IK062_04360 [Selenomonadaceae bacterium]|nr:hypothetical protein [Selenomonadaceae bacterium]